MKTRFAEVAQYGVEFTQMQTFAKSFDHTIQPQRNGRLYALQSGEIVFGYAEVVYIPVAYPAFHPELTQPRRVIEVLDGWKHHCQINAGGEGIIGIPLESDRKTFPAEMLIKAGFEKLNRELYSLTT